MADYRVRVRFDRTDRQWLAVLLDEPAQDGLTAPIEVGRYPSQPEAVKRGCTALRFAQAGIPVRAAS